MRRQQRFLIVLVYNLLQAYASVFNFLQTYISKSSKSSSFNPLILSVRIALHCNFMRPANCKEMGIVTRRRGLRRFYICGIHLYTATVQQRTFFSSGGFYGTKERGSELMTSFIAFSRKHTIRVSGHCHLCFSSVRHLCAPLSAKRCFSQRSSFRRRGIAGFTLPLDVAPV